MKAQVKFTYNPRGYSGMDAYMKDEFMLCAEELQDLFDIPEGTQNIVVKLNTRPFKESYKVVSEGMFAEVIIYLSSGVEEKVIMNDATKGYLLNLIDSPKTCYVAVAY